MKVLQNYLNILLPGSPFEGLSLEEIVIKDDGAIYNIAGLVLNHNLYFEQFIAPRPDAAPKGPLAEQIKKQWGSFKAFQKAFVAAGVSLFGSGWVWLSAAQDKSLDYQNRRADHLAALWSIVNWDVIEKRYDNV